MRKQVETFLPLFNGFYCSIWDGVIDSEIEYLMEEGEMHEDADYSIDFEGFSKDVTKCVDQVLSNLGLSIDIEFQELRQPKFYNYSNDSINVLLSLDYDLFMIRVKENEEELTKMIKDTYSSCDGFISSHSNNFSDWLEDLENDFENQKHKVGSMLEMLCELEGLNEWQVYEEFCSNYQVAEFIKF